MTAEEKKQRRKEYNHAYYQANRETAISKQRRYRKGNPEKVAASVAKYVAANPDKAKLWDRKTHLKAKYGITLEQYDEMFSAQNGRCAICGTGTPGGAGTFHVDHCHDTAKVRGLLCMPCNTAIGHLKHNPHLLRKAAQYIEN